MQVTDSDVKEVTDCQKPQYVKFDVEKYMKG